MKTSYSYSILRYHHDVVVGEFVNVGIALHAPEVKLLGFRYSSHYARISEFFRPINHQDFRSILNYLDGRFAELAESLAQSEELPLENLGLDILPIAYSVLPKDDNSLQWSPAMGGLTENPAATLEELHERYVLRYIPQKEIHRKDDQAVWKGFHRVIQQRALDRRLQSRIIEAPNLSEKFDFTYQNGITNLLHPISFDLTTSAHIQDKAVKWYGLFDNLAEAPEKFKVIFLLGKPSDGSLMKAYSKAENILNRLPVAKDFIPEGEENSLADRLEKEAH
jgi:hypothetical protein